MSVPYHIVACDPGASGGFSGRKVDGTVWMKRIPETNRETFDFLTKLKEDGPCIIVVEKVGHYNPSGNTKLDTSRIGGLLKLREDYGALKVMFELAGIPCREVMPSTWMRIIPNRPKGVEAYAERKRATKRLVQQWFPEIKATLWNADALAILVWAIRNTDKL